jgi:hypothetical protein
METTGFFDNVCAHVPDDMVSFVNFTILSVWRLYSISDRIINEYEAVGGMRSDRENKSIGGNLPMSHFFTTNHI